MSATAPVPAENNKLTAFTAATSALTFAIFGIAVPASTYVMIRFTEYYKMEQTAPLQFIGKTFPWLPLLLAIAIPLLLVATSRAKLHQAWRKGLVWGALIFTLAVGGVAMSAAVIPVVSMLNSLG